ncbi:MAG TPA: hypothetical protein VE135_07480 [Pyrinomonadaceae bacterium]|nr:hypothetical protein [Pyrinomonadaceae bacterium]
MSSKAVLNPRIKISKTGRPYVDVADLVKARLARIEKARQAEQGPGNRNGNSTGNTSNVSDNSSSRER